MRARFAMLLAALGLVAGAALAYSRALPRLVQSFPPPGADGVPPSEPIALTFAGPMQPESVSANLLLQPALEADFSWQGFSLIVDPQPRWPSGETITVTLKGGARSAGILSLPLGEDLAWSFTVSNPLIAYLWPANGPSDLYALNPVKGEIFRLTNQPQGLLDFSIAADQTTVYYSARNDQEGSDLYRLDDPRRAIFEGSGETNQGLQGVLVLACHADSCRNPQPSPDGNWLAYDRQSMSQAGEPEEQVWLLPLRTGANGLAEKAPSDGGPEGEPILAGEEGHQTHLPAWSSSGSLAFYDENRKGFTIRELNGPGQEREALFFTNQTGTTGSWSPDGGAFVSPEIILPVSDRRSESGDLLLSGSRLLRFSPSTRSISDLTRSPGLEDAAPSFSPDGASIAFARKLLDLEHWSRGRQLWVMAADGGQVRQLTDEPFFTHSGFAWSPDNRQIAYVRFSQEDLTAPPELWLVQADGSHPIQLVIGGYSPLWIP